VTSHGSGPLWSREYPFEADAISRHAPALPGVYELLQSVEYGRYQGKTRILKIGCSRSSLRDELSNHLVRHTAANRLARIRNREGTSVSFKCAIFKPSEARVAEKALLRAFEDECWDLPVLNSTRGYDRRADRHYRQVSPRHGES
jgi:hypothetical protein